ncbi:sensor histidine kinase [Actinoplanes sp. NPDC049265]|uniref:sensor histidine kinase n=1 Tax=Actinoplanes sp. NPDC049265 TaxID=3363902 RepID=UPI003710AD1B
MLALFLVLSGVFGTAPASRNTGLAPHGWWAYVPVVVAALVIVLRRRFPLPVLGVTVAAVCAYTLMGLLYGPILFSVGFAVYMVAARRPLRVSVTAAAVSSVLIVVCGMAGTGFGLIPTLPVSAWVAVPLAVGVTVRVTREQRLQSRRDELRRHADAERLRVAQEVHDVVGHGLAAITMQADIALHVLAKRAPSPNATAASTTAPSSAAFEPPAASESPAALDSAAVDSAAAPESPATLDSAAAPEPPAAVDSAAGLDAAAGDGPDPAPAQPDYHAALAAAEAALAAISKTSRESLDELRVTLGAVRRGPEEVDDRTPAPGLARLDALVDRTRSAGVSVELSISGPLTGLPTAVDLAAYRVVQESLTNVLRHAGSATAAVRIAVADGRLGIAVTDTGRGVPQPAHDGGHGLVGMRERVTALGGSLDTGPGADGGFAVTASIPLRGAVPRTYHPGAADG